MRPRFDNTYLDLPEKFYTRIHPTPVAAPEIIRVNAALAEQLGFDPSWLSSAAGAEFVVGNQLLDGTEPIAMVYGGHQFGNWAGQLGDGRAVLLGEVIDQKGARFDVQLKGSGPTPYSRGGDGRAPLGPVLREYIVSEAMAALGIATTRALAAASTGERVRRQQMLPGAVLVRVAKSHIRVGTFEFFGAAGDADAIDQLARYAIRRHFPELAGALDAGSASQQEQIDEDLLVDFLEQVSQRQAELVAKWALVGFIHGVMNTDNTLISGETIDYGPCAFMDIYDHATVFSSIDHQGRYAFGNQPKIAQWNIARLAVALLGPMDASQATWTRAQAVIDAFPEHFQAAYARGMAQKLGFSALRDDDWPFFGDLLDLMLKTESDYTLTFVRLTESLSLESPDERQRALHTAFGPLSEAFSTWIDAWQTRLLSDDELSHDLKSPTSPAGQNARIEQMRRVNPLFIPRNHRVNQAIEAAQENQDFSLFHRLVDVLARPFDFKQTNLDLARPPALDERVRLTFCGT